MYGAGNDPFGLSSQAYRFCMHFTLRLVYSRHDKYREWLLQCPEPHPRNDMQRRLVESRKCYFLFVFVVDYLFL